MNNLPHSPFSSPPPSWPQQKVSPAATQKRGSNNIDVDGKWLFLPSLARWPIKAGARGTNWGTLSNNVGLSLSPSGQRKRGNFRAYGGGERRERYTYGVYQRCTGQAEKGPLRTQPFPSFPSPFPFPMKMQKEVCVREPPPSSSQRHALPLSHANPIHVRWIPPFPRHNSVKIWGKEHKKLEWEQGRSRGALPFLKKFSPFSTYVGG